MGLHTNVFFAFSRYLAYVSTHSLRIYFSQLGLATAGDILSAFSFTVLFVLYMHIYGFCMSWMCIVVTYLKVKTSIGVGVDPGFYAVCLPVTNWQKPCISFRQSHSYLPGYRASLSFGQYQIALLCDRGTCVWATCPELLHESGMARSQIVTVSWSQIWCPFTPPRHTWICLRIKLTTKHLLYLYINNFDHSNHGLCLFLVTDSQRSGKISLPFRELVQRWQYDSEGAVWCCWPWCSLSFSESRIVFCTCRRHKSQFSEIYFTVFVCFM